MKIRPSVINFKGTGHYWQLLKVVVSITNLLGNKQWGAVDSIQHFKSLCWRKIVFEKEVMLYDSSGLKLLYYRHLNSHKAVFSFHYSLATSMTDWVKISTDLLFYAKLSGYTGWEYWSLTILPNVSCAFKKLLTVLPKSSMPWPFNDDDKIFTSTWYFLHGLRDKPPW